MLGLAAARTIDRAKLNVKGSVAIGHPFAATGTRIVGSLAKLLVTRGSGRGLISVWLFVHSGVGHLYCDWGTTS